MRGRLPVLTMVFPLSLVLGACLTASTDEDHSMPGEVLGTYYVTGPLQDNTCGPNAFEVSSTWDGNIKLSRDKSTIYWYNGKDLVQGQIASDGTSFTIQTQLTGLVQAASADQPGCAITRQDTIKGTLQLGGDAGVDGFTGDLSYSYSQVANSDCTAFLVQSGVIQFPCAFRYSVTATRK